MSDPTISELTRQLAVLEERMNTRQAEHESAIERLRADMANWKTDMANWKTDMADWKTDMANWKADMAKRENRLMLSVFGAVGLATAILGLFISIN